MDERPKFLPARLICRITLPFFFIYSGSFCQSIDLGLKNYKVSIESPYRLDKTKELTIGITSAAMITTGILLNLNQPKLDSFDIINSDISTIPSFDEKAIHQYDDEFLLASNVLLYTAMAMPFISFADKRVSGHAPQIIAMYIEALALNTSVYMVTTGLVTRRRPLTYNTDTNENGEPIVPFSAKLAKGVENSFFSGHTSTAAAATFYGAKVFTDFRPHSKLVPFVWGAAIAVPGFVGFSRYKAGKHFPTDVITGFAVGATIGYMVPVIHKAKDPDRLSLYPTGTGLGMTYKF